MIDVISHVSGEFINCDITTTLYEFSTSQRSQPWRSHSQLATDKQKRARATPWGSPHNTYPPHRPATPHYVSTTCGSQRRARRYSVLRRKRSRSCRPMTYLWSRCLCLAVQCESDQVGSSRCRARVLSSYRVIESRSEGRAVR